MSALAAAVLGVAPAQAATGSISGRVTSHGVAVTRGVIVSAYQVEDGDWNLADEAATDEAGDYVLRGLEPGDYQVLFESPDGTYAWEVYDDTRDSDTAETVTVGDGQVVTGIDADLLRGGHIAGTVTDEAGAPIRGASANVVVELPDGDWQSVDYSRPTGADGAYDIGGLPPGTYRVELFASGYLEEFYDDTRDFADAEDVVLVEGGTVSGIDASLSDGATISGKVTDAAGQPLEGVDVYAESQSGESYGYTSTAADGTYTIEGLEDASFLVGFDYWNVETDVYLSEYYDDVDSWYEATPVPTTDDAGATGIDAQLVAGEHQPLAMTNLVRPTVGGVPMVGSTLTAWTGTWSPAPRYAEYYWFRDGIQVNGAYSRTYVPTAADIGKRLSVLVVVGAPGYEDSWAWSPETNPVAAVPTSYPPVVVVPPPLDVPGALASVMADLDVTGKPKVGRTVKVTHLDAELRTAVSYRFQWYAGGKAIAKAKKSRLKVTRAMAGKKLTVKVTAKAASTTRRIILTVGKVR